MSRVLLTGGAVRLGALTAMCIAECGCDLLLHYNSNREKAMELANFISSYYKVKVDIISCDFLNEKLYEDFIKKSIQKYDCNILFNNASLFDRCRFYDLSFSNLKDHFMINAFAPILLSKLFIEISEKRYIKIINVVDNNIIDKKSMSYFSYFMSKKTLMNFSEALDKEKKDNISLHSLYPDKILEDNRDYPIEELMKIYDNNLKYLDNIRNILK